MGSLIEALKIFGLCSLIAFLLFAVLGILNLFQLLLATFIGTFAASIVMLVIGISAICYIIGYYSWNAYKSFRS